MFVWCCFHLWMFYGNTDKMYLCMVMCFPLWMFDRNTDKMKFCMVMFYHFWMFDGKTDKMYCCMVMFPSLDDCWKDWQDVLCFLFWWCIFPFGCLIKSLTRCIVVWCFFHFKMFNENTDKIYYFMVMFSPMDLWWKDWKDILFYSDVFSLMDV